MTRTVIQTLGDVATHVKRWRGVAVVVVTVIASVAFLYSSTVGSVERQGAGLVALEARVTKVEDQVDDLRDKVSETLGLVRGIAHRLGAAPVIPAPTRPPLPPPLHPQNLPTE